MEKKMTDKPRIPIVSSSHLVSEQSIELSELEYGLILSNNAFQRWVTRCMNACGVADLSYMDILVLHNINHRDREKRVSDVCFNLNIEDTHTVTYAIRKLVKLGFVSSHKKGKENFFYTTPKGIDLCQAYRKVREECLVDSLNTLGIDNQHIGEIARVLRSLSGLYDEAARAAASL